MTTKAERLRERLKAETELHWAIPQVSFALLADAQVSRIRRWVRAGIKAQNRSRVPGTSYILKERRLGRTNRLGWRWVVYVGPYGAGQEKSVHLRRQDAIDRRRHAHAWWWAEAIKDGLPYRDDVGIEEAANGR